MTGKSLTTKKLVIPSTFFFAFIIGYYMTTYQYSLLDMAEEFMINTAQLGVLAGANFAALIVVPPLLGVLADRKGKKVSMLIAAVLMLVAMSMFFFINTYEMAIVTLFIGGAGLGSIEFLYLTILGDAYPDKVTRLSNFVQAVNGLGCFLGPLVASALGSAGALWRQFFVLPAVFMAIALVMMVFTRVAKVTPEHLPDAHRRPSALFKSPIFYMVLICMMLYMGMEASAASFADTYFVKGLNSEALSALSLSLFWVMMIPSRMLSGIMKRNHTKLVLFLCIGLAAVFVGIGMTTDATTAVVLMAVAGFLCGPIWPTVFANNQKAFPFASATAGSFTLAFGGLGGFVFPVIIGAVGEGQPLAVIFYAIAVVAVMGFVANLIARRLLRRAGIEKDTEGAAAIAEAQETETV